MRVAFDPVFENPFSVNCFAYPAVRFDTEAIRREKFDAVFISHYHDDHCSFASLDLIDRATPVYMFCIFEEMFTLLGELGFENVYSLRLDEKIKIGGIEITPKRALDADVDAIFIIRAAGQNILHVVDAWIGHDLIDELADERWDLVLWPFQTMRELEVLTPSRAAAAPPGLPPEWLEQLRRLKPRWLVPGSCQFNFEEWSWLRAHYFPVSYRQFAEEINKTLPETRVVRLNPGEARVLHNTSFDISARLPWVAAVGDADVDYSYDPGAAVPDTAAIARRLGRLAPEPRAAIEHHLRELPGIYRALPELHEGFFAKPRHWRLSVYEPDGTRRDHDFILQGRQMTAGPCAGPDWLTEIPAVKLWGALAEGESLNSLYLRINDRTLSAETELRGADVLEDPLLRCLFNGRFASYQRAQLRRLKQGIVSV